MGTPVTIERTSELAAPRAEVWAVVSTMDGVNAELMPLVRMTHPAHLRSLEDRELVPGEIVFHSWLLLFGVIPFDRHALALESVDTGVGFEEESSSWVQRRWCHERTLADRADGGTSVTDRLEVEPRLGLARPLVGPIVARIFAHRHRRLVRRFGAA